MKITPNREVKLPLQVPGNQAKACPPPRGVDTAVFDRADSLQQTLRATPLVRPEMVVLARQRIEDTQYPGKAVIAKVALVLATNLDSVSDRPPHNQA